MLEWDSNEVSMGNANTITIIVSILIPMLTGFGWIIHRLTNIETRLTIVETILAMAGFPIKPGKGKGDL